MPLQDSRGELGDSGVDWRQQREESEKARPGPQTPSKGSTKRRKEGKTKAQCQTYGTTSGTDGQPGRHRAVRPSDPELQMLPPDGKAQQRDGVQGFTSGSIHGVTLYLC